MSNRSRAPPSGTPDLGSPCYDYCSPPTSPLFPSRSSSSSPLSLTGLTSLSLFDGNPCEGKRGLSKRRRDEPSTQAGLSRLKRKFGEIEELLDIVSKLKKVCPERAGTQVLEWQKDSVSSAAATLRGVLVDFADELQDTS